MTTSLRMFNEEGWLKLNILSEAKDPSARTRPFRLSQGILSALLFMTMLFSLHRGNH